MADDKARKPAGSESEREIASADFLFGDDPLDDSPGLVAQPAVVPGAGSSEVFDLAGPPISVEMPVSKVPAATEKAAAHPPAAKAPQGEDQSGLDPARLVEHVWTRGAEWGPNLVVVGVWVAVFVISAYVLFNLDQWGLSFLMLIVGSAATVILAYPMLITLERPVRITPEQAVRDYYHALSHHLPHFRRMWLLLSSRGRAGAAYGSLEGFKGYWHERLGQLRAGRAGALTPLVFEVVDFESEKSAGKVRIEAQFAVKVSIRGQRQQGPIEWVRKKIALVRGPDKMWYLEDGTLPHEERAAKRPVNGRAQSLTPARPTATT